ncbi:MAG: glycine cleavage system aminomethyltransferase GcvT [Clostridia bacterium]|nr:glycine cleavage system aminomethyltransferase GcvT [Clostridia bacterium]
MELKTPLYDIHVAEGGKIVPFAGYLLPVQYGSGVIKEHMAVREQCGMFDVSHMGEVMFRGETALKTLNHLMTNDFTDMPIGKVRYSVMCNEKGGCVDDLIVYKFDEQEYFVVVNAANKDKDVAHMMKNLLPGTEAEDISDTLAEIALQGPKAPEILAELTEEKNIPKGYYTVVKDAVIDGMDCIISRTGYTGELGYEIFTKNENAEKLWKVLRTAGEKYGLIPCGLGARDTLRLEAGMPLYGHEMNEEISPLEASLNFGVKMNKEEFIGKEALIERGEPKIIRVGLEVTGRGIVREHQDVYADGKKIGTTTSGTHCPYIGKPVAMAIVDVDYQELGTEVEVEVRGRRIPCKVVPYVFYKRAKKA